MTSNFQPLRCINLTIRLRPTRFAFSFAFTLLAALLCIGGCDRGEKASKPTAGPTASGKKTSIVVTTGMIRDMVVALVGDDADVHWIMGPGVDPHLYQPTRTDSVKMLQAEIVVYNGLHLEGRLSETLRQREKRSGTTISVGDLLPQDRLVEADAGTYDPHIWMDVDLWGDATLLVADKMADAMPAQADSIRKRAQEYHDKLAALDKWGAKAIESIPEERRVLITAHDAFNYFSRRYKIGVHAPQGISTASEPSIREINDLVKLVVDKKVPAIFFESSVSPRAVESIVEGAKQGGVDVSDDYELFSDSLGAENSPQGNYIGMLRHNFSEITRGLGGTIPESETEPPVAEEKTEPVTTSALSASETGAFS